MLLDAVIRSAARRAGFLEPDIFHILPRYFPETGRVSSYQIPFFQILS